eukprot:COSAG05_NODE_6649_length_926_cov_1.279323_2_plen_77_part_00
MMPLQVEDELERQELEQLNALSRSMTSEDGLSDNSSSSSSSDEEDEDEGLVDLRVGDRPVRTSQPWRWRSKMSPNY